MPAAPNEVGPSLHGLISSLCVSEEFAVIQNEVIAVKAQHTSKAAMTGLGMSWWHMTVGCRNEMGSITLT